MEWSTACPDWAERLVSGRSIIPPPIFTEEAEKALKIFKRLRVVDLPGQPTFGECADQWVFDFVAAVFGAYDAETGNQLIREFYMLISKKNTKSTLAAGIMLTALILCWRQEEEHLILSPTKEIADNSFKPAASMVRADDRLKKLLHVQDHLRVITHRVSGNSLKVVAADVEAASGKKAGRVLVDEHWLFGKRANAESMFMEATGGQVSRNEGWVIYLTTQSDDPPAGVFAQKLNYYRAVRDGKIHDPRSLPVLYEFPDEMVSSGAYRDPENFHITNPNIGRSVSKDWLVDQMRKMSGRTDGSFQQFLAKHLNVEIGMNLRTDRWTGADFWEKAARPEVSFDWILTKCEVAVVGVDGGGLDDLLGLAVLGREIKTRRWVLWAHAWAHRIALERRKEIAPRLLDFASQGDLTIVDTPGDDVRELADYVMKLKKGGLLPDKNAVGVDAAGIGDIVAELVSPERGLTTDQIVAISQGWRLNGAIKTCERRLAGGEMVHAGRGMMDWCVSNARIVQVGNAVTITKQVSGTAKIDPLMATFDAVSLMALDPAAQKRTLVMFAVG